MEKSSKNVRFIFIVNYANEIIAPILSRCAVLRFMPLKEEDIRQKIKEIASSNKLPISDEAVEGLIEISHGDMRRAINYMQSLSILEHEITFENVFEIAGMTNPKKIEAIIRNLINNKDINSLEQAHTDVRRLLYFDGFQGKDIIRQFELAVHNADYISTADKLDFTRQLGEAEFHITQGSSELIQLTSVLSTIFGFNNP